MCISLSLSQAEMKHITTVVARPKPMQGTFIVIGHYLKGMRWLMVFVHGKRAQAYVVRLALSTHLITGNRCSWSCDVGRTIDQYLQVAFLSFGHSVGRAR